jgi:3-hydroxyacyl-CoA dehydrogenase/enoyl-CoA hydratase/3-hydroxybutyryl-CoA epimerase
VVGAIHGACAGGGYELALATRVRIATDAPETRIGLPETGIGTIPGWGGCVRLPRLIGAPAALQHIADARLVSASEARATGLVDEIVPVADLKNRAQALALELAAGRGPVRAEPVRPPSDFCRDFLRRKEARGEEVSAAVRQAIDVIAEGWAGDEATALAIEARGFSIVTPTAECRRRIQAFFERKK